MRTALATAALLLASTSCSTPSFLASPPAEDVVFVVLDTVRADHTSLCGYDRPTTPGLQELVAAGATYTCDGRSPASWTLPSHATYFTGQTIPEHHFDSMVKPDWSGVDTLADRFAARGYTTVLVTANPVLVTVPLLAKGFQRVFAAHRIDQWRGPMLARHVRAALLDVPADKPLFLVVNIMDAHDPYPKVPDDVRWLPPQPELDFHVRDDATDHDYHRFMKGEMSPEQSTAWLSAVTNGYDWGLRGADDTLRSVLAQVRKQRQPAHPARVVITSDHGEFLGEHGMVRHGGWLWEPVMRVPLIVADTRPDHPPPALPDGPLAMATVFDLVLDGRLPEKPRPVVAFSSPSADGINHGTHAVSMWSKGGDKMIWTSGVPISEGLFAQYKLPTDPGELSPTEPDSTAALTLSTTTQVRAYRSHVDWRNKHRADSSEADVAALRALGYVAPDPNPAGELP
jgi:hypothetical protein